MRKIYFKTNGPLFSTEDDSSVYIEREADKIAYNHIRNKNYIALIEPRQQGKTSLINHLMKKFISESYAFVYVDLTIMDKSDEVTWYRSIYTTILRKLQSSPVTKLPSSEEKNLIQPRNGNTWFDFLVCIAKYAKKIGVLIVIVLDEVGATPPNWSTNFFSVIRSAFVQRNDDTQCLDCLNFIIAGAFDQRSLIKDPVISNFNIHHRVILPDFTLFQIMGLIKKFRLFAKQTTLLAEDIYSWTNGQPSLTQCICEELVSLGISRKTENTTELVNLAVQRFLYGDRQHLAHIRDLLTEEPDLTQEYVKRIWLHHYHPKFDPANNHIHARLALIGIIKAGPDGNCVIRNRFYENTLTSMYSTNHNLIPTKLINIFFSYSHKDEKWLHKLQGHLAILKRQGLINDWYDRDISAGANWEEEIKNHIDTAHIIIMLISSSFIESEYCYSKEMNYALDKNRDSSARIIPIIIRPVHCDTTPLSKFNALPTSGKAVTTWSNTDKALVSIVKEISKSNR